MGRHTSKSVPKETFNLHSRLLSHDHYPPGSILTSLVAALLNSHYTTALRSL